MCENLFTNTCRTCLVESVDCRPLFEDDLCKVLMNCCDVQVSPADGLPKHVCPECLEQLMGWLKFKEQVKECDSGFRLHLKEVNLVADEKIGFSEKKRGFSEKKSGVFMKQEKSSESDDNQSRFVIYNDSIKEEVNMEKEYNEYLNINRLEFVNNTLSISRTRYTSENRGVSSDLDHDTNDRLLNFDENDFHEQNNGSVDDIYSHYSSQILSDDILKKLLSEQKMSHAGCSRSKSRKKKAKQSVPPEKGKRGRCNECVRQCKDRKSQYYCAHCLDYLCLQHVNILCKECFVGHRGLRMDV